MCTSSNDFTTSKFLSHINYYTINHVQCSTNCPTNQPCIFSIQRVVLLINHIQYTTGCPIINHIQYTMGCPNNKPYFILSIQLVVQLINYMYILVYNGLSYEWTCSVYNGLSYQLTIFSIQLVVLLINYIKCTKGSPTNEQCSVYNELSYLLTMLSEQRTVLLTNHIQYTTGCPTN